MTIINYIKPELIVVSFVLYYIGTIIKETELIKDKYIPCIVGVVGIAICMLWVLSTVTTYKELPNAIFTSIVQGVLVAGLSTYGDQMIKQLKKDE